jgi:hypothetical protein
VRCWRQRRRGGSGVVADIAKLSVGREAYYTPRARHRPPAVPVRPRREPRTVVRRRRPKPWAAGRSIGGRVPGHSKAATPQPASCWAALCAAWRDHRPVAWMSLDAGDNDPSRLWTYVAEALSRIHPTVGQLIGSPRQSPHRGDAPSPSSAQARQWDRHKMNNPHWGRSWIRGQTQLCCLLGSRRPRPGPNRRRPITQQAGHEDPHR